jgi:hypothetical protein
VIGGFFIKLKRKIGDSCIRLAETPNEIQTQDIPNASIEKELGNFFFLK